MNHSKAESIASNINVLSQDLLKATMEKDQLKLGRFSRPTLRTVLSDLWMWRKPALILLGMLDVSFIFLSTYLGYSVVYVFFGHSTITIISWTVTAFLACSVYPLISLVCGLYDRFNTRSWESILARCGMASALVWAITVLLIYVWVFKPPGRWIFFIGALSLTFFLSAGRFIVVRLGANSPTRILFIGNEDAQNSLLDNIDSEKIKDMIVVNDTGGSNVISIAFDEKNPDSTSRFCRQEFVNLVIFQDASGINIMEHIVQLLKQGVKINDLVGFFEEVFFKTPVDFVNTSWLILADKHVLRHSYRALKRAMDILISVTAIILTFPLWCVIALIIKLTDRGPLFYSQIRVGRGSNHFNILKFRTMEDGCENNSGPKWALCDDPRITGIGKILRKTRLDELPQFWNVLQGHMSVVGPRPERPEFVNLLVQSIPNYDLRHLVRPGITGWAQINFRYGSSVADSKEKACYDLYYVKHGGFPLDLYILVRTIGVLMAGSR